MDENKHVIWDNRNLDVNDDWKEAYKEHCELNDLEFVPDDESAVYDFMVEMNSEYLEDERSNLNVQLPTAILVIADLGRWNGRFQGYKEIESGNIKDCLQLDCDYHTWFVDEAGDLRCDAVHHDGVNHYLYRAYRDGVSDEEIEDLKELLYEGKATSDDIERVTVRLGDEIGKVYGWEFPAVDESSLDSVIDKCAQMVGDGYSQDIARETERV